jgi:hypothetical protein
MVTAQEKNEPDPNFLTFAIWLLDEFEPCCLFASLDGALVSTVCGVELATLAESIVGAGCELQAVTAIANPLKTSVLNNRCITVFLSV